LSDEKPIWTDRDDVDVDYDELVSHNADNFLAEIKKLNPSLATQQALRTLATPHQKPRRRSGYACVAGGMSSSVNLISSRRLCRRALR
jgi:hypothetical protein